MNIGFRITQKVLEDEADIGLPWAVFVDPQAFIKQARAGLPGGVLRDVVGRFGNRRVFCSILDTDTSNLSRFYQRAQLRHQHTEPVLDTVKLFLEAIQVFEDRDIAMEWIATPVNALGGQKPADLLDTFAGRTMVRQVLGKIEDGEFS